MCSMVKTFIGSVCQLNLFSFFLFPDSVQKRPVGIPLHLKLLKNLAETVMDTHSIKAHTHTLL